MEAIVLAGGLGTRLQGVIGAYPKCMAEVNGKPFLHYLLRYLDKYCTRVILSLGYKHNIVVKWLEEQEFGFELDYIIEEEPLGTGGGIQAAIDEAAADHVAVVNGDTMFQVNLRQQLQYHLDHNAEVTLALKRMHDFERYGVVQVNDNGIVTAFDEKQLTKDGLINGGVYFINREAFLSRNLPDKFSFEKDYLERFVDKQKFYGVERDGYFIDIGIPEDYTRVQADFKNMYP